MAAKIAIPEWAKPGAPVLIKYRRGAHLSSPVFARPESIHSVTRAGWVHVNGSSFKIDGETAREKYRRGSMYGLKILRPDNAESRKIWSHELAAYEADQAARARSKESMRKSRDAARAQGERRRDALSRILCEVNSLDEAQREALTWALGEIGTDDE